MNTFRQMTNSGMIKRADAEKIDYKDLHIEPGFNIPGRTEGDNDEDDESLFSYICGGGRIPDLEVRPREDGGVWIVDGHRRHKQIGRAIACAAFLPDPKSGRYLIPIKQFVGNDVDRLVRIATSNSNKALTASQLAFLYKQLSGFNLGADDIAKYVHRSVSHVREILVLANSNHDVQQMVGAGQVSVTIATKMVKAKGEGAGAALKVLHEKAKSVGKKKVTAAVISPKPAADDALDGARFRRMLLVADWSELADLRAAHIGKPEHEFVEALKAHIDALMEPVC